MYSICLGPIASNFAFILSLVHYGTNFLHNSIIKNMTPNFQIIFSTKALLTVYNRQKAQISPKMILKPRVLI